MTEPTSTRPYLIRAIHEWCTDNGVTPYLAVRVDKNVQVPREFVNDGEIVLNVSYDATGSLQLGNDYITFKARFGGRPRDIMVPVERVMAIYARESGQGMSFPVLDVDDAAISSVSEDSDDMDGSEPAQETAEDTTRDARVVQLVSSKPAKTEATDAPDDEPPVPPAPSAGQRPALKRVK